MARRSTWLDILIQPEAIFHGHEPLVLWRAVRITDAILRREVQGRAFADALFVMKRRIDLFASLPLEKLNKLALQDQLGEIGCR